nr:hypothetical protein [uncultured Blautia sp.]
MKENMSFTEGKIMQPLLLFAVPVLLALFLQAMYDAVDLLIVGKFASSADVSAVSTGSQIMTTLTNLVSSLMNAPEEAFQKTIDYIRICGGSMLVIVAYNLIGCIFRGLGDSRTPLITVAIACVRLAFMCCFRYGYSKCRYSYCVCTDYQCNRIFYSY